MPNIKWTAIVEGKSHPPDAGAMRKVLAKWAGNSIRRAAKYPPPPSSSTYRRTGTLGRNWRQDVGVTEAQFFNEVEYAGWVQGAEQVGFHARTGWERAEEIAHEEWDKVSGDVQGTITDIAANLIR